MSMSWTCFIPGTPTARAEKRVTFKVRGKDGKLKTVSKLADKEKPGDYKAYVKKIIAEQAPQRLLDGPLSLTIWAYRDRPKSLPKKHAFPTTKPDASNYQKLIEDCLKGLVIREDALVVDVSTKKRFCDPGNELVPQKPGVWVEVHEVHQARGSHLGFALIGKGVA